MATRNTPSLVCPVGESQCRWLDEAARLRQQVTELDTLVARDPLTGLYNYRYFCEVLPSLLARTRRNGRPTCLALIDVDHFKQINDQYGHEVGNLALRQVSSLLQKYTRSVDIVCRYGGEEFVIILPDTPLRAAVEVGERIREMIEQTPIIFEEGEFDLTISAGIDTYTANSPLDEKSLIKATDQLMYQAKQQGRNQIMHRDLSEFESRSWVSNEERDALQALFE